MGLSHQEDQWVTVSVEAAMGLSMLGALFIVAVYTAFKDLRCYATRLVVYMEVLDFLNGVSYLLPESRDWCVAQAVLSSYFSMGSIVMTSVIAYSLYVATLLHSPNVEKKEGQFVVMSLLLPLPGALLPLTTSSYGKIQGWCWVKVSSGDFWVPTMWRLTTFYLPLWIIILFNTYVYSRILRIAKEQYPCILSQSSTYETVVKKLMWYPLVLAASYLPLTVVRIMELADYESDLFYLLLVAGIAMGLNGFGNALVYGLTPSVKYKILGLFFPSRRISLRASKLSNELR